MSTYRIEYKIKGIWLNASLDFSEIAAEYGDKAEAQEVAEFATEEHGYEFRVI